MPLLIDSVYPSAWLKGIDLPVGQDVVFTIRETHEQKFDDARYIVLGLEETTKELRLNVTNALTVSELYGPDADVWVGKKISLHRTELLFQGKKHEVVRIRSAVPSVESPDDDSVPF
jgi:hypothetical protein